MVKDDSFPHVRDGNTCHSHQATEHQALCYHVSFTVHPLFVFLLT
jgi:hypothetical protein